MGKSTSFVSHPGISVCTLIASAGLTDQVDQLLEGDRYSYFNLTCHDEFLDIVEHQKHQIDCLIFQETSELPSLVHELHLGATLLPTVILEPESAQPKPSAIDDKSDVYSHQSNGNLIYHKAEVHLQPREIKYLSAAVSQAINQFMRLPIAYRSSDLDDISTNATTQTTSETRLSSQDKSLSKKLHERLGYLGIIYKRNPAHFFKNLSKAGQQDLLEELRKGYREIISMYFEDDGNVNQHIDMLVNMIFFADLPTAQIIQIHMELMDAMEKQLIIEGRNPDFLLGYRLALIDTMAHLCEMYRRSILRAR